MDRSKIITCTQHYVSTINDLFSQEIDAAQELNINALSLLLALPLY